MKTFGGIQGPPGAEAREALAAAYAAEGGLVDGGKHVRDPNGGNIYPWGYKNLFKIMGITDENR